MSYHFGALGVKVLKSEVYLKAVTYIHRRDYALKWQTGIPELWTQASDARFWTLDSACWALESRRWTLDAKLWTLDSGRWTLHARVWTLDSGRWFWALDAGHCYWLIQNRIRTQFLIFLVKLLKILWDLVVTLILLRVWILTQQFSAILT